MNKEQLLRWVDDHRELLDCDENPFASTAWLRLFIEQIAQEDWRFYADPDSLLICYSSPDEPHVLRALKNFYTCLLCAQEAPRAPFPAPVVDLAPLDDTVAQQIAHALRGWGWYVRTYFAAANHYLPCEGLRWDAYLAGRSSQLRNTLRRKGKKFPGELEIITGGERLSTGIAAYQRVYHRSWKQPEPYPLFIPDWIHACAEHGWLRLGVAWVDGTPIAAQFWIVREHRAYVYKLAYDEAHKALSAGSLLTAELMRHVLDVDQVVEVDYLTGDDDYKREWMTHRRERVGLLCCNLGKWRGALRAVYEAIGSATQPLRAYLS
jgi:hypothetical protein